MPRKRRESKRLVADLQPNGIWHAVGSVAGKRIRQSLGTRDETKAQEQIAILEARLWKRHNYGDEAIRTFEEAAESYMKQGGERTYLEPLLRHFKGRNVGSIKPADVREAALKLYPAHSAATRNRQGIVPARAVLLHAHDRGWCGAINVKQFEVTKSRKHQPVDRTWIAAFMAEADASGLAHLSAIVLFMHQTGARVSEAVNLTGEWVELGARRAVLVKTKTDEYSPRDLTMELVARISALGLKEGEPVFRYTDPKAVNRVMKRVAARAGIAIRTTHSAGRHSFGTEVYGRTKDAKKAMDAGGWKSARLFMETYVHTSEAGKSVAQMFDQDTGPIDINKAPSKIARLKSFGRRKA